MRFKNGHAYSQLRTSMVDARYRYEFVCFVCGLGYGCGGVCVGVGVSVFKRKSKFSMLFWQIAFSVLSDSWVIHQDPFSTNLGLTKIQTQNTNKQTNKQTKNVPKLVTDWKKWLLMQFWRRLSLLPFSICVNFTKYGNGRFLKYSLRITGAFLFCNALTQINGK